MTRLLFVLAIVVLVTGITFAVLHRGRQAAAGPLPPVPCAVTIAEPASGLARVRLEFGREVLERRGRLILAFTDARGGSDMLRSFVAELDGRVVTPVVSTFRGALIQDIAVTRGSRELVVTYTIDPTFFPPGTDRGDAADARSRIAGDLAIVRSTSLLPVINLPGVVLGVEFALPPGWVAVTPWSSEAGRLLAPADPGTPAEYLALGPFETEDFPVGAATLRVATPPLLADKPFPVESILQREIELVDAPLKRRGLFVATVVPMSFMHGGAAGIHTIVQAPMPVVLAHEIFHWWNDSTLTAQDAGWFREGLTEYYGIRIAREAGAWTEDDETACLADLNGEMRLIEESGARSLRDASLDPRASRLVYSKGALFWLLVDRRLHSSGRFLEEAVRRVVTTERTGLTTADLRTLFSSVYGGLLDDEFDRYVAGSQPLPDLELGPASGRSGCARDLRRRP